MNIRKEIFTQDIREVFPQLEKAKQVLNIAEGLIDAKIQEYNKIPDSQKGTYLIKEKRQIFDSSPLKSIDVGDVESREEYLEKVGRNVILMYSSEKLLEYWILLDDYYIIKEDKSRQIKLLMKDEHQFCTLIKTYEGSNATYSVNNENQHFHVFLGWDDYNLKRYAYRMIYSHDISKYVKEDFYEGDNKEGIFGGEIVQKYDFPNDPDFDPETSVLRKEIQDNEFIYRGEELNGVYLDGIFTFKEEKNLWIMIQQNEKNDSEKLKRQISKIKGPDCEKPEIQMTVFSPIWKYEGGLKNLEMHGYGKFQILRVDDEEFNIKIGKLPKQRQIFNCFDIGYFGIDKVEQESLKYLQIEGQFKNGQPDKPVTVVKTYKENEKVVTSKIGYDGSLPDNVYEMVSESCCKGLTSRLFWKSYHGTNGSEKVEERYYRLEQEDDSFSLLFENKNVFDDPLSLGNMRFQELEGETKFDLKFKKKNQEIFKEKLSIIDAEDTLNNMIIQNLGINAQIKEVMIDGEFNKNTREFNGKIYVRSFGDEIIEKEGRFRDFIQGKEKSNHQKNIAQKYYQDLKQETMNDVGKMENTLKYKQFNLDYPLQYRYPNLREINPLYNSYYSINWKPKLRSLDWKEVNKIRYARKVMGGLFIFASCFSYGHRYQ